MRVSFLSSNIFPCAAVGFALTATAIGRAQHRLGRPAKACDTASGEWPQKHAEREDVGGSRMQSECSACQYCQFDSFEELHRLERHQETFENEPCERSAKFASSELELSSSALSRSQQSDSLAPVALGASSGKSLQFSPLPYWLICDSDSSSSCSSGSQVSCGRAQSPQMLPEIDTYLKVNPEIRAYFQAQGDRDAGVPLQATLGPSLQFYLKPLLSLKRVTTFDLDDAKESGSGYRGRISRHNYSQ